MVRTISIAALALWWCGSTDGQETVFRANNIEVRKAAFDGPNGFTYHMLFQYRTNFATNFQKPVNSRLRNDPAQDLSRLATTYYACKGPVGLVFAKFNWFRDAENTYSSDSRLPAALTVLAAPMANCPLPVGPLVGLWSEPPIGVVGMEAGTVGSYARPFQHLHLFERNPVLVTLSLPPAGTQPYFHYLADARSRGVQLRVFEGEPRPTLAKHGPKAFYHVLIVEPYKYGIEVLHKELLTKEGLGLCMSTLAPGGILCIHISERYYKLEPVVADAAKTLGWSCLRAYDQAPWEAGRQRRQYSSEWIMVARQASKLDFLTTPEGYLDAVKRAKETGGWFWPNEEKFWRVPQVTGKHLWTDKGANSYRGLYRSDPQLAPVRNFVYDTQNLLLKFFSYSTIGPLFQRIISAVDYLDRQSVKKLNQAG